ncbi:plasma membrane ATPase 1-like [Dorcoceras hygrometricum]|uniref:Plasma membrane ATPase 1-like n=3 Tax=Dorcoceras hygrometricum TaxID=472368 RepID=A0A2Z7BPR0_9LAMI|nr:plasma membrane ATPase 1-like [Dorcoceras hygrometricum]
MGTGIDQLNLHSVQLGYLKILSYVIVPQFSVRLYVLSLRCSKFLSLSSALRPIPKIQRTWGIPRFDTNKITGTHGNGHRPAEPPLCPAWLHEDPIPQMHDRTSWKLESVSKPQNQLNSSINQNLNTLIPTSTRSVLGKCVYLVTLVMSLFDLQDVCIAIGSIATLDLPMVVDLIGIYGLKGPYCTLTTTNWFLQALSVIPRGSWGDVARRSYHDPMGKSGIVIPEPQWLWAHG